MNPPIITTPTIDGYRITEYLQVLVSDEHLTYDDVLQEITLQAIQVKADFVVGFHLVTQAPQSRTGAGVGRRFMGYGTAVKAKKTSR